MEQTSVATLRELRSKAFLTQEELAEKARVSRSAIAVLESGRRTRRPRPRTIAWDTSNGFFGGVTDVVEKVGGRTPKSLETFIRENIAAFGGAQERLKTARS